MRDRFSKLPQLLSAMVILDELLTPLSQVDFSLRYFQKGPFAVPDQASRFRELIGWDLLSEIFSSDHPECWLPKRGRLPESDTLKTGRLTLEQARRGYEEGRTILVRHAERAHPALGEIARDFGQVFACPIDIQLYATPPGEEGFDWHYDIEDVFVIQSSGEKEFRLRASRLHPPPYPNFHPKTLKELDEVSAGPEMRCLLAGGDWLYIPAGHWHKAKAVTSSFHLSVGVMSPRAQASIRQHELREAGHPLL